MEICSQCNKTNQLLRFFPFPYVTLIKLSIDRTCLCALMRMICGSATPCQPAGGTQE